MIVQLIKCSSNKYPFLLIQKQAALVATLLTCATGFRVNYCGGCTDSLFRGRSNDNEIEVTVDDVGRIIASHIDEMALTDDLKATVPDLEHLDEIFFTPTLDSKF